MWIVFSLGTMVEFTNDLQHVRNALNMSSPGSYAEWRGPGVCPHNNLRRIAK